MKGVIHRMTTLGYFWKKQYPLQLYSNLPLIRYGGHCNNFKGATIEERPHNRDTWEQPDA
jgi:hypothetical protein